MNWDFRHIKKTNKTVYTRIGNFCSVFIQIPIWLIHNSAPSDHAYSNWVTQWGQQFLDMSTIMPKHLVLYLCRATFSAAFQKDFLDSIWTSGSLCVPSRRRALCLKVWFRECRNCVFAQVQIGCVCPGHCVTEHWPTSSVRQRQHGLPAPWTREPWSHGTGYHSMHMNRYDTHLLVYPFDWMHISFYTLTQLHNDSRLNG